MVSSHDFANICTLKSLSRDLVLVYRTPESLGAEHLEVPGMTERLSPKVDGLVFGRSIREN